MGIQSSINSLLSQAQSLAAFYKGFDKADQIIKDQAITKNEAKIQTDIASGNAPIKDGKVDPEWLKKRRDEISKILFYPNGKLSTAGETKARILELNRRDGFEINQKNKDFLNDPRVQDYLKSFAANSKLKSEVARRVARASVEARTASINQTKSNFDEHTASLIRFYGKGSENP